MQNLPDLVCFLVYNVYNVFVKGPFSIFDPVKTVLRYFKHTFDKTNNNVNFFSHFFSQSNRYEPQPHFHSIRAWELVNILCCHSIIFDSNSARAHRDWKWRMTPQEEVSICSLHASRGSVQDNHVMYHSYCCNAAAATLIFSVAAVREWESSKRSPSSCSPHHSTHSALLQSVT